MTNAKDLSPVRYSPCLWEDACSNQRVVAAAVPETAAVVVKPARHQANTQ